MPPLRTSLYEAALRHYDRKLQHKYEPYLAHFRKVVGYHPSIALPRRYHEKMLWRKLFDHSPQIAVFCDKLAAREFVRQRLPGLELPDVLWVGQPGDSVPDGILAEEVVIKCNHGCDYNFFWQPDVSDRAALESCTSRWMQSTYGETNYEWGYTQVPRRLFAERLVRGLSPTGVIDINVRASDGNPVFSSVILHNKSPQKAAGYFDNEGSPLRFSNCPLTPGAYSADSYDRLPDNLDCKEIIARCVSAARVLSKGVDYARYDFLSDGVRIFGGEITAYPSSGLSHASQPGQSGPDSIVGDSWDLRKSWFLSSPQRGTRAVYAHLLRGVLMEPFRKRSLHEA